MHHGSDCLSMWFCLKRRKNGGDTQERERAINVLSWTVARDEAVCLDELAIVLDEVMYFDDRVGFGGYRGSIVRLIELMVEFCDPGMDR